MQNHFAIPKAIASLLLFSFIFLRVVAQPEEKIEFNRVLHDFGTIEETNGIATYDFIFKNKGETPVHVSQVNTTCGCTTPVWTKSEVAPQEYGFVKVKYNPEGRLGYFIKSITVTFNSEKGEFKRYLNIIGKVVEPSITEQEKKQIEPYLQTISNNRLTKRKKGYKQFTNKLADIVAKDGFVNIGIEANMLLHSSDEQQSKYNMAIETTKAVKQNLLESLTAKGINDFQMGFAKPKIILTENTTDDKMQDYIRIIPINYYTVISGENTTSAALKEISDDQTVYIRPKDLDRMEEKKITNEKEIVSTPNVEELNERIIKAEVIIENLINELEKVKREKNNALVFAEEMKDITLGEQKEKKELMRLIALVQQQNKLKSSDAMLGDLVFKVQVATSSVSIEENRKEYKNYPNASEYIADGQYKYTIGNEYDLPSAILLKNELRSQGFKDAFVIAFLNGERISIEDAIGMVQE